MLITLTDDKFCAWFNKDTHPALKAAWSDDIPQRIRIGSVSIGLLSGAKILTGKDTFIYVGKKLVASIDGARTRQLRLVLASGQLGFIEGYDVKFFEPVQNDVINQKC